MDFILREADVMCVALRPANVGVLTRVQSALKAQGVSAEWTPRERLHCTLLTSDIPDDATAKAILRGLGLPLVFSTEGVRLEAWGDYLVLVLDPRPALPRIQTDIFNRAEALGLQVSSYAPPGVYRPHVTLGTFPRGSLDGLDGFPTDPLWFDEVVVWNGDYRQVDAARLPKEAGDRLFVEVSGMTRRLVARGGPGSGHFGHEGRPGKVGGSAPGDFHSGQANKRIKVDSVELSRAQRNFLLREMGGSTSGDYPALWEQLQAGNVISGAEVLDDLYAHVEGVIDRVDFGDKDAQAYRDRAKGREILALFTPGDFHSAEGGPVAGKPGATIEGLWSADLMGTELDAVYNGLKAYLADFYPGYTETDLASKVVEQTRKTLDSSWWLAPNGVWIGGFGLDHERSAKTTMRNAVGNEPTILRELPPVLRDQFDDNGNAKVQVFNLDETASLVMMHEAGYLRVNLTSSGVGDVIGRRRATSSQAKALGDVVALFPRFDMVLEMAYHPAYVPDKTKGNNEWDEPPIAALGLSKLFPQAVISRGGPGSGHFGHEGRPGKVGGSTPSDFHSGESADGYDSLKRRIARSLELHNSPEEFLATVEGAAWMDADGHIHKTPAHLEFLIYLESEYDLPDLPMYEDRYRRAMTDMGLIRMYRDETGVGAVFYAAADVTPEQIDTLTVLAGGLRARGEGLGLFSDLPGLGIEAQAARVAEARRVEKEIGESDEIVVERGGPGSGHFGHEGRPGKQGGSLPGDFHSGAGLGGGSIEKDAEGNIVFVGYHTSIEHSEPTEFVFAQRGEGYYIGLDMPFNPGQGTVRRVKVTLPPRAVFDPRDLLSEYGTDVEASRRAWDSLPKGTSRDDFSAHTYFKSLGFRAEVGEIEPGMPQYGRELIVWNKGDVQEREPVEREEAGNLWDKFVRAKESELGVTTYVARSGETRPPKRERKDMSDWRTGKDLPDDIVDRVHLYLSVDMPEQFIVQDVETPTDWKPEISNPLDGDKERLVRWLGYNIRAYHSPDGWDMREAGERAGVINRIPTPIMRERIEFLDGLGSALERATLGPEMVALSEAVTAAFGGEPLPRWAMVQGDPDETIEVLAKGKTVSGVIGQMTLSDWTALDNDSKRRLLGEFYMEDAGLETGGMVTMLPDVVRVLYYDTQDILQAQGFERDSKVRLYRGLIETPDMLLPAEMDGGWVNVEISNLSPWTFSPGVAAEYATEQVGQGSILAMDVPVSMIFCNWETGPASRRWLSYLLMASREPMKAYLYPVQRARLRHG